MEFVINNIWLIALALISGGALLWPNLQQRGSNISTVQAIQLLNHGKAVILDIRGPEQYAAGHVRDARHIPLKDLPDRVSELGKFKSKTIIVVCETGTQSARAAAHLKKAGFTEVVGLAGGISGWQAQGLPLAKTEKSS